MRPQDVDDESLLSFNGYMTQDATISESLLKSQKILLIGQEEYVGASYCPTWIQRRIHM